MLEDFHFIRPLWLLALPVCALLVWLLRHSLFSRSNWHQYCDPALLNALLIGSKSSRQWVPLAGMMLVWFIAAIALAGPTWQRRPQPVYSGNDGRIILFDLSLSMNSTDVSPSRLQRARYKLADLVAIGEQRQQALVVFAGDAWVVAPFTDDTETLLNLIPALDTTTAPVQGSRTDRALEVALELIDNAGLSGVEVILMTDGVGRGEVTATTSELTRQLANAGHKILIYAIGTEQGAPILMKDGGFLKDANGNIVIPGVDLKILADIAGQSNGMLVRLSADDSDISEINSLLVPADYQGFDELNRQTDSTGELAADIWFDMGGWLLIPLLALSVFGFRRGWILCLVLFTLPVQQPVHAFGWIDLWSSPEQRAAEAITNQKFEQIPQNASADWRGAGAYYQQDMDLAIEEFSASSAESNLASAHYNLGNSLAKAGKLESALEAYDQALAAAPDLQDAIFNRKLVDQLLQQQQKQQQQQQQDGGQQQDGEQQNQQQRPEEQNGADDQQQSGDSGQQQGRSEEQNQQQQSAENDDQSEQQGEQQKSENELSESERQSQLAESNPDTGPMSEREQALEQWLKKIPDDPGGLLRRKFHYQQSLRQNAQPSSQSW